MGLDACVYCDCVEKARLRKPLPRDVTFKLEKDGYPTLMHKSTGFIDADWKEFPCEHHRRQFLHHRLGNISLISLFRSELGRNAGTFPILLEKVVYSGTHAGDYLPTASIPYLKQELVELKSFKCVGNVPPALGGKLMKLVRGPIQYISASEADAFMQRFREQMFELTAAALEVNKPIAF